MAENRTYTIYISMHPADRYLYWDDLTNHLSQNSGYAVRYATAPADNTAADLDNVDLILLGVTEKYITWNNSGFVSEALAAMQRNIPILPIMLESGIVNLFNTRCKKLHYIEDTSGALSDETLHRITDHARRLLTDEVVFNSEGKPKVFISYRKQDAAELERLVRLLDAHPRRDDIAVWYDTSLQPGENYSTTIAEQLRSSDLFLMLVTPHILEPNNYIARVEYPMAKDAKKCILPIVMQPTDQQQLYALFPDLPKCITDKQIGGVFAKLKL